MEPEKQPFDQHRRDLQTAILHVTPDAFEQVALRLFRYQSHFNPLYRSWLNHLGCKPEEISSLTSIPFLPIEFFKTHAVCTGALTAPPVIFESSGTTGALTSRHYVPDPARYETISTRLFEQTYGALENYHLLALLPSYLERNNSSLVYMVDCFIKKSGSPYSGFYLYDTDALNGRLQKIARHGDGRKVLIIGVTFALLDWVAATPDFAFLRDIPEVIIMETGGMKGRRKELLREQVHETLLEKLKLPSIHSEYGMTELLAQAYSQGNGWFRNNDFLRVFLRDTTDPFLVYPPAYGNTTGGINVVDLGNLDSCGFIETRDLGRYGVNTGEFQVIGRFDNADTRGCNLMVS